MGIFYLAVLLLFTGCSPASAAVGLQPQSYTVPQENVYDIYLPDLQPPSPYTADHCLLGADIEKDMLTGGDMDRFAALAGTQEIYCKTLTPGDEVPLLWVLECYTRGALPVVTLGEDFSAAQLEAAAKKLGAYHIPLLVEYLPDPLSGSLNVQQYRTRFLQAREIFHRLAPNAAFLWTVDDANAVQALDFYPGDDLVDWAGLQLYFTPEHRNPVSFEAYHEVFRGQKPLLVRLGIAHFHVSTGSYDLAFAETMLAQAYEALLASPGVKAVVYMSENNTQNRHGYNFSLTGEGRLLTAYKAACGNNTQSPLWRREGHKAYNLGGTFYVPAGEGEILINGERCTRLSAAFREEKATQKIFLFSGTF